MKRAALPFIVAVDPRYDGANGLFALAMTRGYLSLVAVLGSLYPVVTVLLAFGVLRERIAPHQLAGAAAHLAGIALYRRLTTRVAYHDRGRRRARRPPAHAAVTRRGRPATDGGRRRRSRGDRHAGHG